MNNISTHRKQARHLPIIFCACLSLLLGGSAFARQHYAPSPEEQDRLAGLRYAALHNDHSKVPELLKALHTPHETYIATALHGLEHLQALEALPDIEAFIQETKTGYAYEQARAARARLLAESEAGNTTRQTIESKNAAPICRRSPLLQRGTKSGSHQSAAAAARDAHRHQNGCREYGNLLPRQTEGRCGMVCRCTYP